MKATLFAYTILPLAKLCSAQTYTSCDPTKKSCPDNPALSTFSYSHSFADGFDDANWEVTSANVTHTPSGLLFPINKSGDNPTIRSKWYIFGGRISYIMRTAPGTGIVSSGMMLSDDLDELDFEFLGGEPTIAQTIYFGKGKTGNRNQVLKVNVPNTQTTTHNFTIVWGKDSTEFYIDGAIVRTLTTTEATTGGQTYPQTPMVVRVGSWAGGDASNSPGTIEWAGGSTDYTEGPFNMLLERIEIESFNPGESYTWRDTSGTWDSIEVNGKANHTSVVKDVKADSDSAVSAADPAGSTSTTPGSSNDAGSRRAACHWLVGGLLVVVALTVY